MVRAVWNGEVLAESDATHVVEGNHYFPPDSLRRERLEQSSTKTVCPWKGVANYYHVQVDGRKNEDAAWVYRDPKEAARHLRDHVAFWKGVKIET